MGLSVHFYEFLPLWEPLSSSLGVIRKLSKLLYSSGASTSEVSDKWVRGEDLKVSAILADVCLFSVFLTKGKSYDGLDFVLFIFHWYPQQLEPYLENISYVTVI